MDFIKAALADLKQAQELLAAHPQIAQTPDFYTALVLGDSATVQRALESRPELATTKGGPQQYLPLVYVCFSKFASPKSERAGGLLAVAKLLLQHGADPNTSYMDPRWEDNPLPCLYGATGLNNNPALGLLLLEAGAQPNDRESLYHSTEHPDLTCLKLLLQHGAVPQGSNALKHMLDYESEEGVRLLLTAGADPNEANAQGETALHWAVKRGRSARVLAALVKAGAHVDAPRKDGRSAFALAKMNGQAETVMFLHRAGANMQLSPVDALLGACAAADQAGVKLMVASARPQLPLAAEYQHFLVEFASNHQTGGMLALLTMGVPIDARGELGATALHWACWKGYADLVKLLLEHNAPLQIEDHSYHSTPSGWLMHGLRNCDHLPGSDYPEATRLLLAAGAQFAPTDMPTGHAGVDAILKQNGLI